MKLAIMQPYFFPYIGYFQLIYAADKFVFYDDVNYIKGGWINRNRILVNNKPRYFTVPLNKPSSFIKTANTEIKSPDFLLWKRKMYKTLEQNYGKSPFYQEIMEIVRNVLESEESSIGELAKRSVVEVLKYLEIDKEIVWSSNIYGNSILKREERILDICDSEKAEIYYNLIGGISIYDKQEFKNRNIQLEFLKPQLMKYDQPVEEFVSSLSILDILMNNSRGKVEKMLLNYVLV